MEEGLTPDFYVLPEGCISSILSFTSPIDVCRSSLVSSIFRSAADSDSVWERFLPSDYQEIISRSASPVDFSSCSKKELYFHFCDHPILIDDGNKSFALDKWSGKKFYMIGARELSIEWGDTPEYWSWRHFPGSRFSEVAELLNVRWLEILGKMDTRTLSHKTTYVAYFVYKFTERAYGFHSPPAEVSVRFGGGGAVQTVYLKSTVGHRLMMRLSMNEVPRLSRNSHGYSLAFSTRFSQSRTIVEEHDQRQRGDGWMEIKMGEFYNDQGEDGEVEMSLMEVKGGEWKAGLIIQGIEVRPKGD